MLGTNITAEGGNHKERKMMDTGKALEIVHAMASRLYKHYGELATAKSLDAELWAEAQDALNTVEDFIVNNFESDED